MAEATPPESVPAPDAAEAPVERAPDAQPSETPAGAEPATNAEQVTEKPNEPEEKPSGKLIVEIFSPSLARLVLPPSPS